MTSPPCWAQTAADHCYGEGREALLDAAIHVVARGGLRRLTYRAVAAEAGVVTHGLVAHHFGSRDVLLEEALRYALAKSVATTSLEPGTNSVADFTRNLVDTVRADPDLQAFQYELLLETRRQPQLGPYAEELYATCRHATRRQIKALGLDDDAFADVVFAALDGIVFQLLATDDADTADRTLARLRRLVGALVTPAGRP